MESGERLASPSPPRVSSPAGSAPVTARPPPRTPSESGLAPVPPAAPACGRLFRMADQHFSMSGVSSSFPLLSHPAFGLFSTAGSGRSEFGGLGTLGMSAALAAHPQLGAFPDWWRASETRGPNALFHPLLALPPLFPPPFQNHHAAHFQVQSSSGKNSRSASAATKGANRAVNGGPASSAPSRDVPHRIPGPAGSPPEKTPASSRGLKSSGRVAGPPRRPLVEGRAPTERTLPESPSLSGSSSDSSDGESSGDLDDEDDDEEDGEPSSDSEDSEDGGGKEGLTPAENKRKRAPEGEEARNGKRSSSSYLPRSSSPAPTGPLRWPRTSAGLEEVKQQATVIQATGLAASPQPPAVAPPSHRDPKPSGPPPAQRSSPPSSPPCLAPSSPKPPSGCSSPKPPTLTPSHRASPKCTQLMEHPRVGSRAVLKASLHAFNMQQPFLPEDSFKAFSLPKQQDSPRSLRKGGSPGPPPLHANLFLSGQSAAQDAPLALLAPDPLSLPVNLSTSLSCTPATPEASTSSAADGRPRGSAARPLLAAPSSALTGPAVPTDAALRSAESDVTSSKDSDDSAGDEDSEDSDGSLSESDSVPESDSDGSEDDSVDRTPPQLPRSLFPVPSSSLSSGHSPLNLQLIQPRDLLSPAPPAGALPCSARPSSATPPGPGKRRRVTDEQLLTVPLQFGWKRETRVRAVGGRLQGEVSYHAPCGKKLRQYPDVMKYLSRNGITEITRDNFSFSTKMKVGDFYEVREGPKGVQRVPLKEEQIAPCIIAMDGRRGRQGGSDPPPLPRPGRMGREGLPPGYENNIHDANGVKLLRKLEAQEIARQATQIKLMRKLEKQAVARAAKEARRQQAIMAAEERRKKKEEMKIQKQQDKMKRIQQIRVEKELRAQHIVEEKRRKREEAANARVLEAEKRSKEKELRRQQAVLLKHQEVERHRLDMERERRRQHLMLMKALDARKKVEERERLKQEKKDEKRLNKERKLELKRRELQMAKELKKPTEDMCLADHKSLPEVSRVPGLLLPGSAFSDCLMVLQFLHSFGGVLGLAGRTPSLRVLQEGLLNLGGGMAPLHALLVSLLSAAVRDPGLPAGNRTKTALGDHLTSVTLTGDNVSEILQLFMEAHGEQPELVLSLKTKPFQAHSPTHKASVLAFLVNELCCSKAVVSEIDRTMESMTSLRKDMWAVEGRLRKLRSAHARRTGGREGAAGDGPAGGLPVGGRRRGREGDSEDEEEEEDDSEDQGDDEEDEEEESRGGGGKKGKKELCEEEDDSHQTASVEELEKQIEKLSKHQSHIQRKLFDSSHSLRSTPYGQDRYHRRYWLLPPCGGLFLEGGYGGDELEELNGGQRQMSTQGLKVKEEQQEEESSVAPGVPITPADRLQDPPPRDPQNPQNLFLQEPSSFSKLSTLLEVARMSPGSDPGPLPGGPGGPDAPRGPGVQAEQLFRALTERSGQWFSLLPRSPCDASSVTSGSPRDTSPPSRSPPCLSPHPPPPPPVSHEDPPGFSSLQLAALQAGGPHRGLPFFPPFGPLPPMLVLAYQQQYEASGTTSPFLVHALPAKTSGQTPGPARPGKPPHTPSPAPETTKTHDYPDPRPIPENMASGWWRVRDLEELQGITAALHSRGVREKSLQKQIQKHLEYMTLACSSTTELLDVSALEEQQVNRRTVEGWCVEEQAMEVDISLLQQVEALERKVTSGGLQVKGWRPDEAQSEREDLVYHQHRPPCPPEGEARGCVVRRPDNPLDIAVCRLAQLEANIERSGEGEVAPGMRLWRRAMGEVRSSAQLSLCIQQLQKSMTWQRSIMKACCQLCGEGDNEELLLLCDGCDQGCHTYCLRPRISSIPEGDWFCPTCLAKGSGQTPQEQDPAAGGPPGSGGGEPRRQRRWAGAAGEISEDEAASPASSSISSSTSISSSSSSPREGRKDSRKRRAEESSSAGSQQDGPAFWGKKAKTAKDNIANDLAICRVLLAELETQQDSWPFLLPVNQRTVPGYRKVIKRPMDFRTIREKLTTTQYLSLEPFLWDVNLVFDNCERFNEDDSEIGRAGHSMRRFFDRRRNELLNQTL